MSENPEIEKLQGEINVIKSNQEHDRQISSNDRVHDRRFFTQALEIMVDRVDSLKSSVKTQREDIDCLQQYKRAMKMWLAGGLAVIGALSFLLTQIAKILNYFNR